MSDLQKPLSLDLKNKGVQIPGLMLTLKRLWPYLKPFKRSLFFVIFAGAVATIAQTRVIALIQPLIDKGFLGSDRVSLKNIVLQALGLYAVSSVFKFLHMYVLKFTSEKVTVQIQKDLQDRFMSLNLGYHSLGDSGSKISRVINDVAVVQWGLNIFADLFREPFLIMGLLAVILNQNWRLSLVLFVGVPVIVFILRVLGKSVRKYSHHQQQALENFTSTLKESLDGLRVIQSFNLENEMRSRLQNVVNVYLHARQKIIRRQEGAGPLTDVFGVVSFSVVIYYLGVQIIEGHLEPGGVMAFIFAVGSLQAPARKIQEGWARLEQTFVSVDRVFGILEDKAVVPEVSSPKPYPPHWTQIEFKDVSFKYSDKATLDCVNLQVRRGEIVALVGESGSGKSTLVNLIERFYDPQIGNIFIDGISIRDLSLREWRSRVALVTQDVFLFNDTIARNIEAGAFEGATMSVEEAAKLANAHDFIVGKPNGYMTIVGERGGLLSGGEKQRVSIARAIYKNAPILILDEATSALDSASEVEVQKGLDRLMEGRTTFVIAHRFSTILNADRILVLENGRIVEQGTHQTLVDSEGPYAKLCRLQGILSGTMD